MGQVRAKFRCMEISHHWNGECTIVRFMPVMARNGCWKDDETASAENASFWHATPSGEMKLTFKNPYHHDFELGHSYYVDMAPDDAGDWELREYRRVSSQLDVVVSRSWADEVKMSINNEDAWPAFAVPIGSKWHVEVSPATG